MAAFLAGVFLWHGEAATMTASRVMLAIGIGLFWGAGIAAIIWASHRRDDGDGRVEPAIIADQEPSCHDALTGLPNRILFLDRLAQALFRSRRRGQMAAVLYIDLDGFRAIGETLGREASDLVMKEVASRLVTVVREVDTVARLDDGFAVILGDLPGPHVAARVANEIVEAVALPIPLAEEEIAIEAAVGIAFYPGDADTPEALVRAAAGAMRDVGKLGISGFSFAGGGSAMAVSEPPAGRLGRASHQG